MSRSPMINDQPNEEDKALWPSIEEFPEGEIPVLLVFHGLMGLAYNTELKLCEVGMLCHAPKHELSVEVYDRLDIDPTYPTPEPLYQYRFGPEQSLPDVIKLDIVDPVPKFASPVFYLPPRKSFSKNSFRLMIDLEGRNFYNRKLQRKQHAFKPLLHVKSGVFHAAAVTEKDFFRVAPNDQKYVGQIAEMIGAAIYLKDEGYVALRLDRQELKLRPREKQPYLIMVKNLCPAGDCQFDVNSSKKELRNDFYLYCSSFEVPDDKDEYELIDATSKALPQTLAVLKQIPKTKTALTASPDAATLAPFAAIIAELYKRSSKDSPCGEVGFGQSSGLGG